MGPRTRISALLLKFYSEVKNGSPFTAVFIRTRDCYIRASRHLALLPNLENKNYVAFTDGPDSSQINNYFVEETLVAKHGIALSTR